MPLETPGQKKNTPSDGPSAEPTARSGRPGGSHSPLIPLRTRILLLLVALVAANLIGALTTIWYTQRTQELYESTVDRDLQSLTAAMGLQTSLAMQKGYTTYFYLSGDEQWLVRLEAQQRAFGGWLALARERAVTSDEREILNKIESLYVGYTASRDQVVDLYRRGERAEGQKQHWRVRDQFDAIYTLCDAYRNRSQQLIDQTRDHYRREARLMSVLAWSAMPGAFVLGLILAVMLMRQVLLPIRRLAANMGMEPGEGIQGNEIAALSDKVRHLLQDVDHAHTTLAKSRETLMQSEKLAVVGRLAAGVAHSIRNPLTSVKMRLFSLERSLEPDTRQKEDLEVIGQEIAHIDGILKSFLEFSRPPKIRFQQVSPSDVVDNTLELLKYRLESSHVTARADRKVRLPEVSADPERLKEALVNLVLNASEAMPDGGEIVISEEEGRMDPVGPMVVLRIRDTGPGIPSAVQDKIFEPFFSTKEDGSGLGLAISRRIVEEHGGFLGVKSAEGHGATFTLALPLKEAIRWRAS